MYKLSVINDSGEQLILTNNPAYDVLKIEGTNPPPAAINTAVIAGVDGTRFTASRVNQRNLVITLNIREPIETNRIQLYNFFRVKRPVKVLYQNKHRDVYIEGYVETLENSLFGKLQQPQISIICPQPFWLSSGETVAYFSFSRALFSFPFSISSAGIAFSTREQLTTTVINAGEIETGGIITFTAKDDGVTNPFFQNLRTGKHFGIQIVMQKDDTIIINTIVGEKSVKLIRGGAVTNLLSYRMSDSSWIQFAPQGNMICFSASAKQEDLTCEVMLVQKYEGV